MIDVATHRDEQGAFLVEVIDQTGNHFGGASMLDVENWLKSQNIPADAMAVIVASERFGHKANQYWWSRAEY